MDKALKEADGLLSMEKDNPYFLELKGQMLVDFGKLKEALPHYKRAVGLLPSSGLIRTAYAHVQIETATDKDKAQLEEAVANLERAERDESNSGYIQHLLATAYGRLGREPESRLHLAEEALLGRNKAMAEKLAKAALPGLKPGSPAWLRAKDILAQVAVLDKEKMEERGEKGKSEGPGE